MLEKRWNKAGDMNSSLRASDLGLLVKLHILCRQNKDSARPILSLTNLQFFRELRQYSVSLLSFLKYDLMSAAFNKCASAQSLGKLGIFSL